MRLVVIIKETGERKLFSEAGYLQWLRLFPVEHSLSKMELIATT